MPTLNQYIPFVAICMATFRPDLRLFQKQINSIIEQSHTNWVCTVNDDCSPDDTFRQIEKICAVDSRFIVRRNKSNLGFYRNFEAALCLAPDNADYIAFADQDDYWQPEKLAVSLNGFDDNEPSVQLAYVSKVREASIAETQVYKEVHADLRAKLSYQMSKPHLCNLAQPATSKFATEVELCRRFNTVLVYCDCRIVSDSGAIISPTFWRWRKNQWQSLEEMIVSNTVSGAGAVFKASLKQKLLPFPDMPRAAHDHWLACVALCAGGIKYIDHALYDYVQHGANVIGHSISLKSVFGRIREKRLRTQMITRTLRERFAEADSA